MSPRSELKGTGINSESELTVGLRFRLRSKTGAERYNREHRIVFPRVASQPQFKECVDGKRRSGHVLPGLGTAL
jgi:hypothetical protein